MAPLDLATRRESKRRDGAVVLVYFVAEKTEVKTRSTIEVAHYRGEKI